MSEITPFDDVPDHADDAAGADHAASAANPDPSVSDRPSVDATASTQAARLRRSRGRRVIAGVSGGIAERFDINENLVRITFAVLTLFWGLGVAIYLVMWVVVPLADVDAATRRDPTPVSSSHRLSVAVLASVVVVMVLAVAVARHLRILGPGLALAWVVFLMALAVIAIKTPARRVTLRRIVGVIFLAFMSVVIIFVGTTLGFLESTGVSFAGGNGDFVWQPTSLAQVARGYHVEFGMGTLDLSAVDFPATGSVVAASVAAGELRIVVPANAVVSLTTNVGIGVVADAPDTPFFLRGVAIQRFSSLPAGGPSRVRRSPHLVIDARVGIGRLVLMRAVSPPAT